MDAAPCQNIRFSCFTAHKLFVCQIILLTYFGSCFLLSIKLNSGASVENRKCGIGPAFVMCTIYTSPTFVSINLLLTTVVIILHTPIDDKLCVLV